MGDEEDADGTVRTVKEEVDMETTTTMTLETQEQERMAAMVGYLRGVREKGGEDMAQLPLELLYLLPPTIESIRARAMGRGGVSVFGRAMDVDGDGNVGGSLGGGGVGGGLGDREFGTEERREVSRVIAGISCVVGVQG